MFKPTVFYAITYNCIRSCNFCFNIRYAEIKPKFNINLFKKIVEEMKDRNANSVEPLSLNITGGEPLLEKKLEQTLNIAAANGLEVFLTTAGVKTKDTLAKTILNTKTKLTISFDCVKKNIYESTRGQNTYTIALNSFDIFVKYNCIYRAIIVVNTQTLPHISETISFLQSRYGVDNFILMELSINDDLFSKIGARIPDTLIKNLKIQFPSANITIGHDCPITLNVSPNGHYFVIKPPKYYSMLGDSRNISLETAIKLYKKTITDDF